MKKHEGRHGPRKPDSCFISCVFHVLSVMLNVYDDTTGVRLHESRVMFHEAFVSCLMSCFMSCLMLQIHASCFISCFMSCFMSCSLVHVMCHVHVMCFASCSMLHLSCLVSSFMFHVSFLMSRCFVSCFMSCFVLHKHVSFMSCRRCQTCNSVDKR